VGKEDVNGRIGEVGDLNHKKLKKHKTEKKKKFRQNYQNEQNNPWMDLSGKWQTGETGIGGEWGRIRACAGRG
jgi:hypothetical protein